MNLPIVSDKARYAVGSSSVAALKSNPATSEAVAAVRSLWGSK